MVSTELLAPPLASVGSAGVETRDPLFATVARQPFQTAGVEDLLDLVAELKADNDGLNAADGRRRGTTHMLRYFDGFEGDTWQQRWVNSGMDDAGGAGYRQAVCKHLRITSTANKLWVISSGVASLFALDVVRPSFDFALTVRFSKFWGRLLSWRGDPDAGVLDRITVTDQTRTQSACVLGRLVLLTGRPVATLTADDLLAYRDAMLARRNQTVGMGHLWVCLADLGTVEGDLYRALRPGKKTVTELVDRYGIESQRVRNMLIAYLTERSVAVDYSTLRSVTGYLCLNFWKQVEEIAPGIDTLDLPDDVATAWKEQARWRTAPDGSKVPRRGVMGLFMTVRGFYADLIQLAHEEPARWAMWAYRSPVSENDTKTYRKWKLALRSEMHERTRTRAIRLNELVAAAERRYHDTRVLLDAATAVGTGERFVVDGNTYQRADAAAHAHAHPKIVAMSADGTPSGDRVDMVFEEEDAFWGFAVVEVLRHTGIRIEEMLELTQLDLHEYEHRDPTIGKVLLLHVNPSKSDRERMVVIAPELAAVFAAMARRIRHAVGSTHTTLPLLVAYDYGECVNTEALPFLFQRTAGRGIKGTTRPMSKVYVQKAIDKVVAVAGLRSIDGNALRFTPHDFRRIFATDALAASLPPHIIQKLLGHATLSTTQGYAAIFPDDIIRSHRAFIENRRTLRPGDEYRDVTPDEWEEFEEHFAKRKIAIGDCMRAYGTNCVHEYACEQCKLARPDIDARPRLERTRVGLFEQLEEAAARGWNGETERLTHILAGVNDKLDELDRAARRASLVMLPNPVTRRGG